MADSPLQKRLSEPGPKRILSLDGGGIRGLVTLGYLRVIERMLRKRYKKPDLVLSDYFDLIGGTSTGSIIATGLAMGWPVDQIHDLYHSVGKEAFKKRPAARGGLRGGGLFGEVFDERPLIKLLRGVLGERTLGSPDIRVALTLIAKRVDTASVWALVNIPTQKYYEYNKGYKLWKVVRASTAAPTKFAPVWIEVAKDTDGLFVDGGMSMYVNPALKLLMVAGTEGFGLKWPMGEDKLLLCSIGTGSFATTVAARDGKKAPIRWMGKVMLQFMRDSSELEQTMLQWMSRTMTPKVIDSQLGDLENDQLGPVPILTYLRYDLDLDRKSLKELGIEMALRDVRRLRDMTNTGNIQDLDRLGRKVAKEQVDEAHFPRHFDRPLD